MKRLFLYWVFGVFILTVIFGSIYATGQYVLRSGTDDPQIQFAEDIAAELNKSASPESFTNFQVDVKRSLAPFVIIYDKEGNEVASSAKLDDATPKLPKGVLDHAKPRHSVSWKPKEGVRIAAIIQSTDNGYVLTGRNLRETENREKKVMQLAGLGWILSIVALTGLVLIKSVILKTTSAPKLKSAKATPKKKKR